MEFHKKCVNVSLSTLVLSLPPYKRKKFKTLLISKFEEIREENKWEKKVPEKTITLFKKFI